MILLTNLAKRSTLTKDSITAQQGTLKMVLHSLHHFDLLLANILARIIIQMCDEGLGDVVRQGGLFSGEFRPRRRR